MRGVYIVAIVKCPECRKQVSDKDSQCPYCGAKVNVKIRCPKCNSEEVELKVIDFGSANVGLALVFGWLTALLLSGKSIVNARCKNCGKRFKINKQK